MHKISPENKIRAENPDRPRLYCVKIDGFRFATQQDIDMLESVAQAYGRAVGFLEEEHIKLGRKLGWPKYAGGATSDGKSK